MKIEDNFLDQEKFNVLQNFMLGDNFSWFYKSSVVYKNEITDKFGFIHGFYNNGTSDSPYIEILNPILEIDKPISLLRIKANLLTRTSSIDEQTFHTDISSMSEEKLKQWTIAIFYVNTNNGYTEFEDGTKVESIANRFITFPANMKHRGTSCTDEKTRVVINFNYFEQ
jgi:repressor of nif and glnA expression